MYVLTLFYWTGCSVCVSLFSATASFFMCVCVSVTCPYSHKMTREGRRVRGFIPECAGCVGISLLALGDLDRTLESIVQCYRLCLLPSSVPMNFRHF